MLSSIPKTRFGDPYYELESMDRAKKHLDTMSDLMEMVQFMLAHRNFVSNIFESGKDMMPVLRMNVESRIIEWIGDRKEGAIPLSIPFGMKILFKNLDKNNYTYSVSIIGQEAAKWVMFHGNKQALASEFLKQALILQVSDR